MSPEFWFCAPPDFIAEGRRAGPVVVCAASLAARGRTDPRPSEKPRPKKTPHSATRPKKSASILPVPSVISVSCEPILSPDGVSPSRTEKLRLSGFCRSHFSVALAQHFLEAREEIDRNGEDHRSV